MSRKVVDVLNGGADFAIITVALGSDEDGSGGEVTEERRRAIGNDLDLKFDGVICRVPPAAVKGIGVLSGSEVDILPHVDAGIVGARHVEVDVDGVGCEAGGIPFDVELLSGDDGLVHGRGFVEAASLAGCGMGACVRFRGGMKSNGAHWDWPPVSRGGHGRT